MKMFYFIVSKRSGHLVSEKCVLKRILQKFGIFLRPPTFF